MLVTGKSFALVLAGLLIAATVGVLFFPTRGQAEESAPKVTQNAEKSEQDVESAKAVEETDANQKKADSPTDQAVRDAEDGWLLATDFASQKDREIAERAWNELGFKAVPPTETELDAVRRGGYRRGLKLIGLEDVMNTEGPLILTHIQSKGLAIGIADFDALERALEALASQPPDEIFVLQGIKPRGGIFQYSMRRPQASTTSQAAASSEIPSTEKQKRDSSERRELGTFSLQDNNGLIFRAIDDARSQNLNVDFEYDDDKVKLVVVPKPSEADWPAMLGDPPRKERVIAEKAWERLGLKLIPASQLELLEFQSRRTAGPIKILGGIVPDGLPLPAFLRRVGDQTFETFDDLNAWLNAQEGKRPVAVRAYAFADGHEFLFEAAPTDVTAQTQGPSSSSPKFPSLEDQKLADLAWRMLQLELEPIAGGSAAAQGPGQDDNLRRVKALGYSGGLLVTGTSQPGGGVKNYFEVQRGDILVGLHVWPTTSLKEVADILTRDDLASLSPLKFYVVRADDSDAETGHVVTGRITVQTFQPPGDVRWRSDGQSMRGGMGAQSTVARHGEKPDAETAAEPPPVRGAYPNEATSTSSDEIKVLEEHVKTLESQFKRLDALYKAGSASSVNRALGAYELASAQGELALAQRRTAEAIDRYKDAQLNAEKAYEAVNDEYNAGKTTYDAVVAAAKHLTDVKRKMIHLQHQRTDSTQTASLAAGGAREQAPFTNSIQPVATPQSNESISVLRKFVEREKQQYERLTELAANNVVSAAEVATQKSNYEISRARLEQATRALEYHKAMVALAAAEYETALQASKTPGAVPESELRKLQLKVQAAEAKYKELAE
jgi:hypothetical protein